MDFFLGVQLHFTIDQEKYYVDYEKIISDKFFLFNSRDEVKRFLSHFKISGGNIWILLFICLRAR